MSAFWYLILTSWRNRFLGTLKRVRSPRYAIALLVGILYIWTFLFRPFSRGGISPTSFFLGQPAQTVVTLMTVLTLAGAWVFGADSTALAFTPAEVSILFSAPLTRRHLIRYKMTRAQIAVLFNALIWVFVLRRGGTLLPPPLRAIGLWILFSTMSFHRLGAALVRSSWTEHGKQGVVRHRASVAVFVAIAAMVAIGVFQGRAAISAAHGASEFFKALAGALETGPASWGLLPFRLVVAPTFAHSTAEWLRAIGPAFLVLLIHSWWVLHSDAAFEDAAIAASAERAKRIQAIRERRGYGGATVPRAAGTLALGAVGHPAIAILWKNMLCLRRTAQWRVFLAPTVMAIGIGTAMSQGNFWGRQTMIAADALVLAGTLLMFGGRLMRNDLRHDMQHLPLLKSLPLAARDIVLAEVASSALPMAAVQIILIVVAYLAVLSEPLAPPAPDIRIAILISAPFALVALNGALSTIQNGLAVLFPAWIRLGPTVSTGVEMLGQNLLATLANFMTLALALVVPLLVGYAGVNLVHQRGAVGLALTVIFSATILAAETYGAMVLLGRALSRAEPLQTT